MIGINTAIASPTGSYAGYGFAVPSNIVGKVVEDLMKYVMVQRGYLGLMIRSVDGKALKTEDAFIRYLEGREGGVMLEGVYEDYPGKYYYAFGL